MRPVGRRSRAQRSRKLKRHLRALLLGAGVAVGSFGAIAAGLWGPANIDLDANAYLWLALGSAVPGAIAFRAEQQREREREAAMADRDRSSQLLQALEQEIKRSESERALTARAVRDLGEPILRRIWAESDRERTIAISQFEAQLLDILLHVLSKRFKEGEGHFRIRFVSRDPWLNEPNPVSPPSYQVRATCGYNKSDPLALHEEDLAAADKIIRREIPWKNGLLVSDLAEESEEYCVLMPPRQEMVQSYCRVGVGVYGILWVDGWQKASLSKADRETIASFATMLAVGLAPMPLR